MYLELIETDNYKTLPGGIFNKGFVRSYAKYVGVDEHEALQDYAQLIAANEETIEEPQRRYRPEVLTDDARSASSIVTTVVFAGIILALMTGGILFVVNYIKNRPDTPAAVVSNSVHDNSNLSVSGGVAESNTAPIPVPDQIRIEFRALSEKVSVTSTVDGNLAYDEITPDAPKTYTAQRGVKLRYYRGFADKVQIILNGKQLASPPAPPRGNVEIEITKDNLVRILESGQIASVDAVATPTQATPTAVVTAVPVAPISTPGPPAPRPSTATPRPAFTPAATPRRSPTPIIVGRPPAARPSPN